MFVRTPKLWELPANALTAERDWLDRRGVLRALGFAGAGLALPGCLPHVPALPATAIPASFDWTLPPATPNTAYPLDRPLTDELAAATHNNFYEFTTDKARVWELAASLRPKPWTIEVGGDVEKPFTMGLEDVLATFPLEERTYRFRCVEAWSMAVPWIGVPLAKFIDHCKPLSKAKFIRFVSNGDADMLPGVRSQPWYSWPYYEGLSVREAMNELSLLAVGIYGHALPNQHGAPIRLVVPWKYGYKNIKSIVRIEFREDPPATFWNDLANDEYDFYGNVRPDRPHPRWSQATEQKIPSGERVPTLMYNGYADLVAGLYPAG